MSTQGASKVAGSIALAAVLAVVAIVAWSMLNQSDPAPSTPVADAPAMGDITGYVGRVDRNARTVDVAENMFGLRPITMSVTNDTSITVAGKQGAIGDLAKDMQVRAFYEVRNDVKYVTSIQVITDDAQAKAASPAAPEAGTPVEPAPVAQAKLQREARPPVEAPKPAADVKPSREPKPAMETKPVPPPATAAAPPATRQPAPAAPVAAATPKPAPPAAANTRPVPPRVTDPAPASLESAARSALAPSQPPAARTEAASPASAPSPAAPPAAARPAESDGDGSAAIDWLLKESRRR